ncbi:hypothetical protein N9860_00745 [Akkermansiaceae bacterium]|nr:hypothetical protein [Akkermansiaceae bacterium]MDB4301711.1 hypothetical protein [Akkermansiaceae bacterium]MDC1350092.1 hypothetical protein [Akkermansiaceae bacterium]
MKTDQQLAQQLMKIRKEGYPHPLKVIFFANNRQKNRLIVIIILITMAVACVADPFLGKITLACLSFSIGALFNNFQFIRLIAKGWPFTEKVTDWEKVEGLANAKK